MFYDEGEKGYPFIFFQKTPSWLTSFLVGLLIAGGCGIFYVWYSTTSPDPAADSTVGLVYAVLGTILMVLAAIMFSLRRRARRRAVGQLHAALDWHICFGVAALAILFMHSFGNFNPRSGTYALYAMIALVISGAIGKLLDMLLPRMIAAEANKALTAQGEDRLQNITKQLESIVTHNTQPPRGFAFNSSANAAARTQGMPAPKADRPRSLVPLQDSWDLAYISLEETPQEVNLDARQYRFVPDRKSALTAPGALIPGAKEQLSAMSEVQQALQREQCYRYIIRYWRIFHVALAFLTVALTVWHIEYALELVIPTLFHH